LRDLRQYGVEREPVTVDIRDERDAHVWSGSMAVLPAEP
jgi:hypothetical protein